VPFARPARLLSTQDTPRPCASLLLPKRHISDDRGRSQTISARTPVDCGANSRNAGLPGIYHKGSDDGESWPSMCVCSQRHWDAAVNTIVFDPPSNTDVLKGCRRGNPCCSPFECNGSIKIYQIGEPIATLNVLSSMPVVRQNAPARYGAYMACICAFAYICSVPWALEWLPSPFAACTVCS
jgi:hypothetical protein